MAIELFLYVLPKSTMNKANGIYSRETILCYVPNVTRDKFSYDIFKRLKIFILIIILSNKFKSLSHRSLLLHKSI